MIAPDGNSVKAGPGPALQSTFAASRYMMRWRLVAIHSSISASLMKWLGSKRFQLAISGSYFFQRL